MTALMLAPAAAILAADPAEFTIERAAWDPQGRAVQVFHNGAADQVRDLLFVDAPSFSDALSSQWELAERRAGSPIVDAGTKTRTPPGDLAERTLRFYRISADDRWKPDAQPRAASEQVYACGVVFLRPGRNWVGLWGQPDVNTLDAVLGKGLPAGVTAEDSTRLIWHARDQELSPAKEIRLQARDGSAEWVWVTGGEGPAGSTAISPSEGFSIYLPAGAQPQRLPLVLRVPTREAVQTIPGNMTWSMVAMGFPETRGPGEMGLLESGFTGGARPTDSDWLWKYDRDRQLVPDVIWYRTNDASWRLTSRRFPPVPDGYFRFDDGIVVHTRVSTHDLRWTSRPGYSAPTADMTP